MNKHLSKFPPRSIPTGHKLRPGSVLIELIVCIGLFGTVTIAIYLSLIYGLKINQRSHRYHRASQIAAQEMEILRSTAYSSLAAPYSGSFIGTTDALTELPNGTGTLTISYDNSPTNTIKKATVVVSWEENSRLQAINYSTLIVSQGINQ